MQRARATGISCPHGDRYCRRRGTGARQRPPSASRNQCRTVRPVGPPESRYLDDREDKTDGEVKLESMGPDGTASVSCCPETAKNFPELFLKTEIASFCSFLIKIFNVLPTYIRTPLLSLLKFFIIPPP